MRRDTVTIPGSSHLIIRIPADNPGIWAFHCHLLWHAHGGYSLFKSPHPKGPLLMNDISGGMFVAIGQQIEKLRNMLKVQDASSDSVHRLCSGSMK